MRFSVFECNLVYSRVFACICVYLPADGSSWGRVQMARIQRMAFSAERARPGLPMDRLSLLFHQLVGSFMYF